MTAFARREEQTEQGDVIWEIRSVNHRYLEVSLRLDERFRVLEMPIRKLFSDRLARGKVEATLRYKGPEQQKSGIDVDLDLAKELVSSCKAISGLAIEVATDVAAIDPLKVLQWPGVLKAQALDQEALNQTVMSVLDGAIDELIETRETEGKALQAMIEERCDKINLIAEDTRQRMPDILTQHQTRLQERVAEMAVNVDAERLEQELVLLAQKSDVAEELDRLQNHVTEVLKVVKSEKPIGRRLDFLMQELNREANTLASKSINTETTGHSVDLKVLIEQMREQIQNIE
jgi:uncharacterized protein (TIGR00255 family)